MDLPVVPLEKDKKARVVLASPAFKSKGLKVLDSREPNIINCSIVGVEEDKGRFDFSRRMRELSVRPTFWPAARAAIKHVGWATINLARADDIW